MLRQRTLRGPVQAIGIGLHSGQRVSLNIKPGPIDSGIVFRRVDLDPVVELPALAHRITDTRLNTTLSADVEGPGLQVSVHTIEHLMSALAGLGIDNAQIDITASEVPILDGSAGSFVYLLQSAGLEEQAAPKRFIRILKPVEIVDGDKWVRLEPHEGMKFSFEIAFGQAAIDATGQRIEIDFATTSYVQEIARARTFVMASEVELLRKHGLALGGSLDNAIVVDDDRVLNSDGLRYRDEFAKHKALDAIGDLYLIGHPILGAYHARKSGHHMNNLLVRAGVAGRTPMPEGEDLVSLARHRSTLCIFLSITLLSSIQRDLRAAGWPEDAPILVVHKASWPGEEKIVRTTLADVKEACRQAKIVSQAMIIASPTIGARQWSTLTKSRLYDASFTHRFRRASEERLVDMAVGKLNPRSEIRVPEGQTKTTLSDEASDDNLQ